MSFNNLFCPWCLPKPAHPNLKAEKYLVENLKHSALVEQKFLKWINCGRKNLFQAYLSCRYRMYNWQPGHPHAGLLKEQMFHFLSSLSLLESLAEWYCCYFQRHRENFCSDLLHSYCTLGKREGTPVTILPIGISTAPAQQNLRTGACWCLQRASKMAIEIYLLKHSENRFQYAFCKHYPPGELRILST